MKICITINSNNIINQVAKCLNNNIIPIKNGIILESDIDIKELNNQYKFINNNLIKLTDEEKDNLIKEKENKIVDKTKTKNIIIELLKENIN